MVGFPALQKNVAEIWEFVSRPLRAFGDRLIFLCKIQFSSPPAIVALLATVTTIAGIIVWYQSGSSSALAAALTVSSGVIWIASLFLSIVKYNETSVVDGSTEFNNAITRIGHDIPSGYKIIARNGFEDPILCYDVSGDELNVCRRLIRVIPKQFRINRDIIPDPTKLPIGRLFTTTNDLKIRLASEISKDTISCEEPIKLQKTDYFSDRSTNGIAKKAFEVRGKITRYGCSLMMPDGRLARLDKADALSNQLGGSTLLLTGDSRLVYIMQGPKSDENAQRLASSGSGSFDWQNVATRDGEVFVCFVKSEIERELREEVGVGEKAKLETRLVGFSRLLYRNGKPDFMAISLTDAPFEELSVRFNERKFVNRYIKYFDVDGRTVSALREALHRFSNCIEEGRIGPYTNLGTASTPLLANIYFASEYLEQTTGLGFIETFYKN
jgi:hypothetical protein